MLLLRRAISSSAVVSWCWEIWCVLSIIYDGTWSSLSYSSSSIGIGRTIHFTERAFQINFSSNDLKVTFQSLLYALLLFYGEESEQKRHGTDSSSTAVGWKDCALFGTRTMSVWTAVYIHIYLFDDNTEWEPAFSSAEKYKLFLSQKERKLEKTQRQHCPSVVVVCCCRLQYVIHKGPWAFVGSSLCHRPDHK